MDGISECSTPVSSISGYNNKISKILDERNSDSSVGDRSEFNSPAATLLKSYLRDSQLFTNNVSPTISKLNESIKEMPDVAANSECATPKSVNVIKKKRFDVSSPSAILRERNPFPKEVFDDVWTEEEELPPPLPFNELLKGLHMYAEVRDKEDNRSAGIKQLLRTMGAIVHDKLDNEVTHVIFREGQLGTYKKAKKQNCHLLSMLWLHAVRNTGRRVPEENYPALNLDIYESPLAVKKFRKIKSMQPDYEGVREDYHRKRLEKVFKQKLAGISSTNGSDSDDVSSITSSSMSARKRKSDILPDKKINNSKRRRTTIMSTTTMESDTDENKSRKENKSNQRRKTEFIPSSSILSTIDDSKILKERNVLKHQNTSSKNTLSVLENRNVVVNQTLRPSAVIDLVQGSQDLFSNAIELKHRKDNKKLNEKQVDEDNDLTRYSGNIKDRNVVVNCTLTPPRFEDVLDRSQDTIEKKIKEEIPPSSPSISSGTASQENDYADSPDLRRVLDAIQNDNSGSLRKKLLKGLGIKCPSDKKRDSIKKSPKKVGEVFSFVAVRQKTKDLRSENVDDNDISKNKTASTIFGDSPLLNHRSNEIEKEVTEKLSTRTRAIKTPSRYLNDFENYQSNSEKSVGRRKTLSRDIPQNTKILNESKLKSRRTRLFQEYEDESVIEKSKQDKHSLVNNSENDEDDLRIKLPMIKDLDKDASNIPEKINIAKVNKSTRRRTKLFQESMDDNSPIEKSQEKNSIKNNFEKDNESRIKQSKVANLDKEVSEIPLKKNIMKENKFTNSRKLLVRESQDEDVLEKSNEDKSNLVSDSQNDDNDSRIKQSNNLQQKKTLEENKSTKRRTRLFQESQDDSITEKSNVKNYPRGELNGGLRTKQSINKNLDKKVPEKRFEAVSSDKESLKEVINKRVPATEPRRMSTRRSTIHLNSNKVLSTNNSKLPGIQEETSTKNPQTVLKSKSPRPSKTKTMPVSEPSNRKDISRLNSTTSKKIKLFDPTLDMVDSDLSLPEVSESVENPYETQKELENKTPKRRKIDLKGDKNRRSTFWFQTPEERQKAASKKLTQNFKASQKKIPTIVCTRLHRDQIDVFTQVVKKLGGFEIENNVTSATTHLVVGEPNRTLNMLRAIIRGCWIVSYEWLLQSLEQGHWLQEELYEVTEFSPAVKKCRVERQTFGEPYVMNLFNECGKIFIGTQTSPKSSDLEQLIKLAGGTVVASPRLARIIVGQTYSNADNDVVCVTEKWVLESISHKSVKSFKKFILSTNNVEDS